jgi:ribokinase
MTQPGKICVLGSFVVDLTSRAPHLPVKGETIIGSMFKMGPGGKGANQAVAARRAGGDVQLITKVGRDVFGEIACDNFRKEDLYSDLIFMDDELETGTALIMVDDESANSILVVPGACNNITATEIEQARPVIEQSSILLTQLEINLDATRKAIEIAHAQGVTVVLNTAPVQPVDDDLLAKVDIVTPNEIEAQIMTGIEIRTIEDCRAAADYYFRKGVKKVIITWGKQGVYANDGQQERHFPIIQVKAVDTTGAGDAFSGGFVVALAEGRDFFTAAEFGNVVAGLAVTRFGTAPAMPYREEIDSFMVETARN